MTGTHSAQVHTVPVPESSSAHTPVRETPPPEDDDFTSRYANFDEASVAPADNADNFSSTNDAYSSATRKDETAALKAAEACVPAAIRDYLESQFRVKFNRYVPADEVRIFSIRGEIGSGETPDTDSDEPDLAPELDD